MVPDLRDKMTATATSAAVRDLLSEHFGRDPLHLPVVVELFDDWEHVNVQAGLDAYLAAPTITCTAHGVTVPVPSGGRGLPPEPPSLENLLTIESARPPFIDCVELPCGPGETTPCIRSGLLLLDGPHGKLAVRIRADSPLIGRKVGMDIQATSLEAADALLTELRRLVEQHNVFRGKVVRFKAGGRGDISCEIDPRPTVSRADVILPPATIASIDAHAIGIAEAADDLRSVDRHLKRGLLLYGHPAPARR